MKPSRMKSAMSVGLVFGLLTAGAAFAETQWEKEHPRRDQANDRLENQNKRIHEGVEEGQLTPREAHKLHRKDRAIRHQERRFARHHHGHITKGEQEKINREENAVSGQIHNERHEGE